MSLSVHFLNPYNAELFFVQTMQTKGFVQFEIIINVLATYFWFIWIPMLWVYDRNTYFTSFSAGIVFIRQNLTSTDGRFWRIKTVPALKGLIFCKTRIFLAIRVLHQIIILYFSMSLFIFTFQYLCKIWVCQFWAHKFHFSSWVWSPVKRVNSIPWTNIGL